MDANVMFLSHSGVIYFENAIGFVLPVDPSEPPRKMSGRLDATTPFDEFGFERIAKLDFLFVMDYDKKYLPYDFSRFEELVITLNGNCVIDLSRSFPRKIRRLLIGSGCHIVGDYPSGAKLAVQYLQISYNAIIHNPTAFREMFEFVACCALNASTDPLFAETVTPKQTRILVCKPLYILEYSDYSFKFSVTNVLVKTTIRDREGFKFYAGFLLLQKLPELVAIEMNFTRNTIEFPGDSQTELISRIRNLNTKLNPLYAAAFVLQDDTINREFSSRVYEQLTSTPDVPYPVSQYADMMAVRFSAVESIWNEFKHTQGKDDRAKSE